MTTINTAICPKCGKETKKLGPEYIIKGGARYPICPTCAVEHKADTKFFQDVAALLPKR